MTVYQDCLSCAAWQERMLDIARLPEILLFAKDGDGTVVGAVKRLAESKPDAVRVVDLEARLVDAHNTIDCYKSDIRALQKIIQRLREEQDEVYDGIC